MSDSSGTVVLIVVLVIAGLFMFVVIEGHKETIRDALRKKGARNIQISWQLFDFDESNHTYTVTYEDADGATKRRECKIHRWGSTIYWTEDD